VSTSAVPLLLVDLVDDAAVFPPGSAPLPEAVSGHCRHRDAWYAPMVGPLLVPASAVASGAVAAVIAADECAARFRDGSARLGIVGDVALDQLAAVAAAVGSAGLTLQRLEAAVGKRGEDPMPGLRQLLALLPAESDVEVAAEIPLTWGLFDALDEIARARESGRRVVPKFRTGGLAAELFPSPAELARVVCACRDRGLDFKLTAGLHHAVRHNDPETGFVHHGFVNILVAAVRAAGGADADDVAEILATTDTAPLVAAARVHRDQQRPLWIGFGSCSIAEPVEDLTALSLMDG
jgi:hypothetical protein